MGRPRTFLPERDHYDAHPYPSSGASARTGAKWLLPRPEWIQSLWRPGTGPFRPERVLVAGCGVGSEAFAMRRQLPEAEIVAFDRSVRSIELARRLQKTGGRSRPIRFVVADLDDARLAALVGDGFDFISCHGVLSYVAEPERALAGLRACAADDAALYLGVNGETHNSVRWRGALRSLGLEVDHWVESRHGRDALAVLDAMCEATPAPRMARRSASYLGGDLFGAPSHCRSLTWWAGLARKAGFSLRATLGGADALREVCEQDLASRLLPRTLAECHELHEALAPSLFHRLLFTTREGERPPWSAPRALLEWRAIRLACHPLRLPRATAVGGGRSAAEQRVRIRSACRATRIKVEWQMPGWLVEVLRASDGGTSLGQALAGLCSRPSPGLLRDELYRLYLMTALALLPPVAAAPRRPSASPGRGGTGTQRPGPAPRRHVRG